MIIKIDPLDTLFFRDGKPFIMGDETWANGIFPPFPSVIYGALRSAYFSNHIDDLEKANELNDPTKNLRITGFYLLQGNKIFLPLPNDCVQQKNTEENNVFVLSLSETKELNSSCPTKYVLKAVGEVENIRDGWIDIDSVSEYLQCKGNSFSSILRLVKSVLSEPKIGNRIDRIKGSSEDEKLYRVDLRRLVDLSLAIDFEGLDIPEKGLIKIGGEGKAASYQKYKLSNSLIDDFTPKGKRFKLYLSSPAIFTNGWIPSWLNKDNLTGKYKGIQLELISASIGKPIPIGGFNMKLREPKQMYKAVPAGSVYFFEITDGDIQTAVELLNQTSISDVNPEQGFGLVYIGGIHNNT